MLGLSAVDLEQGYRERRVTKLAWAARNFMELSVWIDYCNLSDQHAERFRDDTMRDLYGLSAAVQKSVLVESGTKDKTLEQKLGELATFAQSKGVLELDDEFKRVSEAARKWGVRHSAVPTSCFRSLHTLRPYRFIRLHRLKPMKSIDYCF
jgi:hypothetical protein